METEKLDEVDAIAAIADILEKLGDKSAAERIVRWAWGKYVGPEPEQMLRGGAARSRTAKSKGRRRTGVKGKKKETLSMIKELNLNPDGGPTVASFVSEKQPSNLKEKIVAAVYYLSVHAHAEEVTIDHIYSIFKTLGWRLPTNLPNMVHQAGAQGWLDTSDRHNIKLSMIGENFVEHDLPRVGKDNYGSSFGRGRKTSRRLRR